MRISIITVNYNNADLLEATIQSVIQQKFDDFEYHIVDGGSTDHSLSIIQKYSEEVTSWVSEKDSGIYDAMNKGISKARGEYCLFLNSGDTFYNDCVLDDVSTKLKYDFNCGNATLIHKVGKSLWTAPDKVNKLFFLQRFSVCHQSLFIRTELLKVRHYSTDYRIVSDYEQIFYEIVVNERTYGRLDEIICNYTMDGVSSNHAKSDLEKLQVIQYFILKGYIEMDPLQSLILPLKYGTRKYNLIYKITKCLLSILPK